MFNFVYCVFCLFFFANVLTETLECREVERESVTITVKKKNVCKTNNHTNWRRKRQLGELITWKHPQGLRSVLDYLHNMIMCLITGCKCLISCYCQYGYIVTVRETYQKTHERFRTQYGKHFSLSHSLLVCLYPIIFITLLVHLVNFSLPFIPNYINHSINNGCASHPVISYISVSASYQHPVCKVGNLEMHYWTPPCSPTCRHWELHLMAESVKHWQLGLNCWLYWFKLFYLGPGNISVLYRLRLWIALYDVSVVLSCF